MRRKREVHITRAAGSQSTHGPLQHFPTGSKLSHPAWFPREITGTQSCSVCVCVSALCVSTQFQTVAQSQSCGHPDVFCKTRKTGIFWEELGCSGVTEHAALRYSSSVFREATQDVRLLCLVACVTTVFFTMISVKLCCIPVASCRG